MRKIFTIPWLLCSHLIFCQPQDFRSMPCRNLEMKTYCEAKIKPGFILSKSIEKYLVILDGVPVSNYTFESILPNEIESVSILKKGTMQIPFCHSQANDILIITTKSASLRKFTIKDFVEGKTLPGTTVKFKSQTDKADSLVMAANDSGIVTTNKLKAGADYDIEVSSVGFKPHKSYFKNPPVYNEQLIFLERQINALNEVVVTDLLVTRCRRIYCGWSVSVITYDHNESKDTLIHRSRLKIFPNPTHRGGNINLELPREISSSYIVRIISLSGAIIHQETINNSKSKIMPLASDNRWTSGTYIVQLINKEGKQCAQQKLIIQ